MPTILDVHFGRELFGFSGLEHEGRNRNYNRSDSNFRVPQKECGKRSSITFLRFRDAFGHFSVTFSDASVTFFVTFLPNSFCQTPFASG